ncbi:MAG: D-alanyl-D-alanine carboxypeptidase [Clostridia bacterium]|nr:D-alanyl-D-alanine carboxypeptidase [Clostridia bacterium]MDD4386471.1 D-alanyl-D-alanine carboxypeptidase [Clostridia bacterium]
MKVFKRIKSKDNIKYIQKLLIYILVFVMLPNVFGMSFTYNLNKTITDESSISTVASLAPTFTFQSKAQVLMEPSTGTIIYANNENEKIFPASVTKVMSLLLTMEAIDSGKLKYTDVITCSKTASGLGGSQIWFQPGEQLTVDEALKAICVVSANDVTVAMAEHLAGTQENFVAQMNAKAKDLGMVNTNFMNAHGIDEDNHYTSAMDIALMSRALIVNHPDVLKYTSIWMDTLRNGTFGLSSTNKLIRFYEGATGIKTGSTSKALFNLSASATRDGTTFIAVVCTAPSGDIRNEEVKQLLDYGFSNFKTKNIFKKNTVLESIKINKSLAVKFDVTISEDVNVLYEKGKEVEYDKQIIYNDNLKAPILKNTPIGKISITSKVDGSLVSEKDIVISEDIFKSKLMEYYIFLIEKVLVLG